MENISYERWSGEVMGGLGILNIGDSTASQFAALGLCLKLLQEKKIFAALL